MKESKEKWDKLELKWNDEKYKVEVHGSNKEDIMTMLILKLMNERTAYFKSEPFYKLYRTIERSIKRWEEKLKEIEKEYEE